MRKILFLLFVALAWAGEALAAGLLLTHPAKDAELSLLSPEQKAFVTASAAEREAQIGDPARRQFLVKKVGCLPQGVELAWSCDEPLAVGAEYEVALFRRADGRKVYERKTEKTKKRPGNLEIGTAYRWTVAVKAADGRRLVAESTFRTEDLAPRLIAIKGVPNVRDLGGRRGWRGRRARQGMIYRSAGLNGNACTCYDKDEILTMYKDGTLLTAVPERSRDEARKIQRQLDAGVTNRSTFSHLPKVWCPGKPRLTSAAVASVRRSLNIRTDVDLRTDRECYGMTGSPLGADVRWVHVSSTAYADLTTVSGKAAFAKIFRVFLDERNYPIDFHCIAGADRTGTLAYVLGALLGYSDDDLLMDWELTVLHNPKPTFTPKLRFEKLLNALAQLPGRTATERAEAFVKSVGYTDEDIRKFREIMLNPAGEVQVALAE